MPQSTRPLPNSNPIRLSPREWLAAALLCLVACWVVPARWPAAGTQLSRPDYRLPSELSSDYWAFRQWAAASGSRHLAVVLGDSVIWGQYARADDTLAHHLNAVTGQAAFANLGVDGLHPAALEGLVSYYGADLSGRPVLLFLNPLWMTSAEQDLRGRGEARFNHPKLIAQVLHRPAAYHPAPADATGAVLERQVAFLGWKEHLKQAYYDGLAPAEWSLDNPYALRPEGRGPDAFASEDPGSPPAPWQERGIAPQDLPWVDAAQSYQWAAFQRTVALLRARGSRVFVLLGPFNTHALTERSRARYAALESAMVAWLDREKVPYLAPPPLPSELYADASHPLGAGYRRLAEGLSTDPSFAQWRKGWPDGPTPNQH